jgi:penicillin amidase
MPDQVRQHDTIQLKGLQGTVTVIRDHWGIPHIRAHGTADAFYAQGFVHAQDRMWHMEWDRRRAYGYTAELIGSSGIEADRLARRMQIERASKADWEVLNAESHAMLEAFTAGVNAYIEGTASVRGGAVPSVEFETLGIRPGPWQVWDCLSIFKIRHVLMGLLHNKLWRLKVVLKLGAERAAALYPNYRADMPLIIPPDAIYHGRGEMAVPLLEEAARLLPGGTRLPASPTPVLRAGSPLPGAGGSNNWVLDGTKTRSGKPLLAGDPHRPIDVPNVYYQNHLRSDEWDVVGVSFPGVPGFSHLGHNDRVAWAITHAGADYQDLYIERFDPHDAALYEYKGDWLRAETRAERIKVKGGADVVETVRRTLHGPVIEDGPWEHHGLAFKYIAFEPGKTFECFLPMMRARTVEELRAAQREWVDPAQNLIMADVDGSIGYHTRGRVPVRSAYNGWLPVPGWSGEHEWSGYIPFEEMPRALNPATHWIATANNKIAGDEYPHYLSSDPGMGYRYERIAELIRPLHGATADDSAAMQADRLSVCAREFVPLLLAVEPDDDDTREALARLRSWDYRLEPDSVPAAIYAATRDALMRLLVEPIFGPELAHEMFSIGRGGSAHAARLRSYLPSYVREKDMRLLDAADPARASWPAALRSALHTALRTLRALLGDDMRGWQWSKLHHTGPLHPLSVLPEVGARFNPPAVPYGGDGDTVQAAGYFPALGFTVAGTQCYRQIIDLGDLAHARWVVPLGASGHPGSPHFADQVEAWRSNKHVPMLYDWAEIEQNAEAHLEMRGP